MPAKVPRTICSRGTRVLSRQSKAARNRVRLRSNRSTACSLPATASSAAWPLPSTAPTPHATNSTSALVHETWMKLARSRALRPTEQLHLKHIVAKAIRHYVIEAARRRGALKRGGAMLVTLDNSMDLPVSSDRAFLAWSPNSARSISPLPAATWPLSESATTARHSRRFQRRIDSRSLLRS